MEVYILIRSDNYVLDVYYKFEDAQKALKLYEKSESKYNYWLSKRAVR